MAATSAALPSPLGGAAEYRGTLVVLPAAPVGALGIRGPDADVAWLVARALARDPLLKASAAQGASTDLPALVSQARCWAAWEHLGCTYDPAAIDDARLRTLQAGARVARAPAAL